MSQDLKPCPFCGSQNLGLNFTEPNPERQQLWWVDCYECSESSHPRKSEEAAVVAWNRRAQAPAAEPLTDEQARQVYNTTETEHDWAPSQFFIAGIRAAERAHGIGAAKE